MTEFLVGFACGALITGGIGYLWHSEIIRAKTLEWAELAEGKLKATADNLRGTF